MNKDLTSPHNERTLFSKIAGLIEESRHRVATTVNTAMVYTYYEVGRYIVEDEQQGNYRAEYGKAVLKELAERLTEQFGKGWSEKHLRRCRFFFNTFSNRQIRTTVLSKLQPNDIQENKDIFSFGKLPNNTSSILRLFFLGLIISS